MILFVIFAAVGVIDLVVVAKLAYAFRLLTFPAITKVERGDLPTVSICVAARNETHAMTASLERIVATDYPKLEIIVLDDGSRDDTSIIIKSFAHAGVRFVEGKPLPEGWLGRTYAQSLLTHEASGELLFFMDVDTLIDRFTVARAVDYMRHEQAKMVSIIPIRNDHFQASTLFATMRHFWTVIRFSPSRPRAASNAWLIDRQTLLDRFEHDPNLPSSVQGETTIARELAVSHEYRLLLSDTDLGMRYEKKWLSQVETSIRLLYPQCDRHWYNVAGVALVIVASLLPYMLVWWQPSLLIIIALQYAIAYYYLSHVWVRYRFVGALLLPVTLAQELILLFVSAYKYRFGTITWKGRPITDEGARTSASR